MSTTDVLDTLPISEVFHRTFQGEGPAAGQPASFVRVMGCNLSCTWCDSAFTWNPEVADLRATTEHRTAASLVAELVHQRGLVVLTGGEPLLYQERPAMRELVNKLAASGKRVHVETNGTHAPAQYLLDWAAQLMVSPKLRNAGPHRGRQTPAVAEAWRSHADHPRVAFKYVCRTELDVDDAAAHAAQLGLPRGRTWVMPEGATREELAHTWPIVADRAAALGLCASHRLHVLAWGNERGR